MDAEWKGYSPSMETQRLAADAASAKAARDFVAEAAATAGFEDPGGLFDLRVATSEVVTNAVESGAAEVEIGCEMGPREALVEIRESGFHEPLTLQSGDAMRLRVLTRAADEVTLLAGSTSASVLLRKLACA